MIIHKGRFVGVGEMLKLNHRELLMIKQKQAETIPEVKSLVRRLDHILVVLRGGGNLTEEELMFTNLLVGDKFSHDNSRKAKSEMIKELQKVRDHKAKLFKGIESVYRSLSNRI